MKKTTVFLVLVICLTLAGCSGRTAIGADAFSETMESLGYEILDITDNYDEEGVSSVLLAIKDDYQIEFFELASTELAVSSYNYNVDIVESYNSLTSAHTSATVSNYSFYTLSTAEDYYVVSRVDNTFIYAHVPSAHKDEAGAAIKELGY